MIIKPGLIADAGRDVCGSIVVAPLAEQTERLVVEADPVAWRVDLGKTSFLFLPSSTTAGGSARGFRTGGWRFKSLPSECAGLLPKRLLVGAGYVTLAVPEAIVQLRSE